MSGPGERHVWARVSGAVWELCPCGAFRRNVRPGVLERPLYLYSTDGQRWENGPAPKHAEMMARKEAAHG